MAVKKKVNPSHKFYKSQSRFVSTSSFHCPNSLSIYSHFLIAFLYLFPFFSCIHPSSFLFIILLFLFIPHLFSLFIHFLFPFFLYSLFLSLFHFLFLAHFFFSFIIYSPPFSFIIYSSSCHFIYFPSFIINSSFFSFFSF